MKRFSELTNVDISESNQIIDTMSNLESNSIGSNDQFPEYMITDSNVVGYESQQIQYTVYRAAEFATIVAGVETVLDIGCGRGDFGDYLLSRHPNVKYTGLDLNDFMIQIGNDKYSKKYDDSKYNLQSGIFNDKFQLNEQYDYVYHINNMSLDYGIWPNLYSETNRYEYLKMVISKSLELCSIGIIFMLHNDSTESEGLVTFSLSPISKILYDMNLKFAIDNTDLPDMYKLVILKNSF
jgi:SAM-dependent methyltransferase